MTDKMRTLLRQHRASLLAKKGVVAVGLGYKRTGGRKTPSRCFVVGVQRKLARTSLTKDDLIPEVLGGVLTDVIEIGEVFAGGPLAKPQATLPDGSESTARHRPTLPGTSIGHEKVTAGTFGCVVTDSSGVLYGLSNNHVLANSNKGSIGDHIFQPGPYDGGKSPANLCGFLSDYMPIKFEGGEKSAPLNFWQKLKKLLRKLFGGGGGSPPPDESYNLIDAALVEFRDDGQPSLAVPGIGIPLGFYQTVPTPGTKIRKTGRTTGYTEGEVVMIDASVRVNYGEGRIARFEDQIVAGAISKGGDSGSIVFDGRKIVGLLFAGSETSTIINPIATVFSELAVYPATEQKVSKE